MQVSYCFMLYSLDFILLTCSISDIAQSAGAIASLQRGKTPPPNECSRYNTKSSEGEAPVLELWGVYLFIAITSVPQS